MVEMRATRLQRFPVQEMTVDLTDDERKLLVKHDHARDRGEQVPAVAADRGAEADQDEAIKGQGCPRAPFRLRAETILPFNQSDMIHFIPCGILVTIFFCSPMSY